MQTFSAFIVLGGLITFVIGFFRPRGLKLKTVGAGFLAFTLGAVLMPDQTVSERRAKAPSFHLQ